MSKTLKVGFVAILLILSATTINAQKYNRSYLGVSEDTTPEIIVESKDAGDVTFSGLVNNERGSVTVRWTEEGKCGNLYTANNVVMGSVLVAPLWTHKLTIENALNIGVSGDERFEVYLAPFNGENPELNISAQGDVYLTLTLAEITPVKELSDVENSALDGTLSLDSIVAKGNLDILLPTAIRMQYLVDAGAATVVIPGTLEFTTDMLDLGEVKLTLEQLKFYTLGIQNAEYSIYELPNGIQLYIDKDGKVHRAIASNGNAFNSADYNYHYVNGQLVIQIVAQNAELNVATGGITAKGETGLDVYLKVDMNDNEWYTVSGSIEQKKEYHIYKVDSAGNRTSVSVSDLYQYKTQDGITYYFFHEEANDNKSTNNYSGTYYAIAVDLAGYMVGVFKGTRQHKTYSSSNSSTSTITGTSTIVSREEVIAEDGTVTETVVSEAIYTWTDSDIMGGGRTMTAIWKQQTTTVTITNAGGAISSNTTVGDLVRSSVVLGGYDITNYGGWTWDIKGYEGFNARMPSLVDYSRVEFGYSGIWFTEVDMTEVTIGDQTFDAHTLGDKANGTYYEVIFAPVNILVDTDNDMYKLDTENSKVEFEVTTEKIYLNGSTYEYPVLKILGDAVVHLKQGDNLTLKAFDWNGKSVYQVFENLMISKSGEVIIDMSSSLAKSANHLIYDAVKGSLVMDGLNYADGTVTLTGNQKLANLSENVAKGSDGNYYYWNGSSWVMANAVTDNGKTTVSYNGVTQLTIHTEKGITYHTAYENGAALVKVGSDHSVTWLKEIKDVIAKAEIPGTKYEVSYLEGENVKLEMEDPEGSLLDGDDPDNDGEDIVSGGDITIITDSTGSVGTGGNMLEMDTQSKDGEINFETPEGEKAITTDTYIYVPEGDMGLQEGTKVKGASLYIITFDGDIIGTDVTVEDGAKAIFKTNKIELKDADGNVTGFEDNIAAESAGDIILKVINAKRNDAQDENSVDFEADGSIIVSDELNADESKINFAADEDISLGDVKAENSDIDFAAGENVTTEDVEAENSDVDVAAGENVTAGNVTAEDGTMDVTAGGDVTSGNVTVDNNPLNVTADGSVTAENVTAADSKVVVEAGEDVTTKDVTLDNSELEVEAGGNVTTEDVEAEGSAVDVTAGGNITADDIYTDNSTVNFKADETIYFDMILSKRSDISLDAGKDILMKDGVDCREYGEHNFIKFADDDTDENSSLTMSAGGDIGTMENSLILDIPEDVTTEISKVDDYYLDYLKLIFDEDTGVSHEDNVKMNEFFGYDTRNDNKPTNGDHLEHIGESEFSSILDKQTPEELAEWIIDVKSREEWTAVLDQTVIESMLKADGEEGLNSEWLAMSISHKALLELLELAQTEETIQQKAELVKEFDKATASKLQAILPTEDLKKQLLDNYDAGKLELTEKQLTLLKKEKNGMTYAQMRKLLTDEEKAQIAIQLKGNKAEVAETLIGSAPSSLITELINAICEKAEAEGEEPAQYLMSDEAAAELLAHFLVNIPEGGDLIAGEDTLGKFLGSLLTEEEIEQLYEQARKESECPETEEYEDDDPRDVNIHIGISTGEGYVYNEGNITITQDQGNLTVGQIKSEREDVVLKALEGSILASEGAADAEEFTEHVLGKDITLEAKENIGNEKQALVTEHRDSRPTIVNNVDESIYEDENGNKEYVLRQDENGNWVLDTVLIFDWIRADYPEEAERLDAIAKEGNIFIKETTGDLGLGILEAEGKVSLTTLEDIIDVRTEEEKEAGTPNVKAETLEMTAQNGAIGSDEDKIHVDIEENAEFKSKEDIAVKADGDLDATTESANGKVYLDVEDDLALNVSPDSAADPETGIPTGDLNVGFIQAGGKADITGQGTIIENEYPGEDACIKADDIMIDIAGDFGTEENPFQIDTAAGNTGEGSLSVKANTVFVEETSDDLVLKDIDATGTNESGNSIQIAAPGNIISDETNGDEITDAAEAQKEANKAADRAEQAEDRAEILEEYLAKKEAELNAAKEVFQKADESVQITEKAVADINTVISKIKEELQKIEADEMLDKEAKELAKEQLHKQYGNLQDLNKQLEKVNKTLQSQKEVLEKAEKMKAEKQEAYDAAKEIFDAARADADEKTEDAALKQQEADEAYEKAQNSDPVITAPGNVTLNSGGNIGDEEHAISTEVGGTISATAGEGTEDDIDISAKGDIVYDAIEGGEDVDFTALGGIQRKPLKDSTKPSVLDMPNLELNALGGDIGSKEQPIVANTDNLNGMAPEGSIYLENKKDLNIGKLDAGKEIDLNVKGNVTSDVTEPDQSNISSENVKIDAKGNIGEKENPLSVNADHVNLKGDDMNLHFIKDVIIDKIQGDDMEIVGDGHIIGNPETKGDHIIGNSLNMKAFGNIGNPLRVNLKKVKADSEYGEIKVKNSYRPPVNGKDDIVEELETDGIYGQSPKTGDVNNYQLYLTWMLLMITAIAILRKKRKYNL